MREVFFDWLRQYRPDLVPRYEELYGRGAYAPKQEQRRLSALVRRDGMAGPATSAAPTRASARRARRLPSGRGRCSELTR